VLDGKLDAVLSEISVDAESVPQKGLPGAVHTEQLAACLDGLTTGAPADVGGAAGLRAVEARLQDEGTAATHDEDSSAQPDALAVPPPLSLAGSLSQPAPSEPAAPLPPATVLALPTPPVLEALPESRLRPTQQVSFPVLQDVRGTVDSLREDNSSIRQNLVIIGDTVHQMWRDRQRVAQRLQAEFAS